MANQPIKKDSLVIDEVEKEVSTATNEPTLVDVLKLMFTTMIEERKEKTAEKARVTEERERFMRARAVGHAEERAAREYTQSVCRHLKDDGRTRIGGQRLSNGQTFYMCSLCYKEYDQTTLPPSLQPNMATIGG